MAGESVQKGWGIIVKGAGFANDSIPAIIWSSVLWFFVGFAPTAFWLRLIGDSVATGQRLLAALLLVITAGLLLAPATVATHELLARAKQRLPGGFKAYFQAFAQHYKRSVGVGLVMAALIVIIFSDIYFFLNLRIPYVRLLAIIWLYFVFFWLLMINYVAPLVVWQPETGVFTVLKRAALLALDNIVVSMMLSITVVLLLFVCAAIRIPMVLVFMGAVAALETVAIQEVLGRYAAEFQSDQPDPATHYEAKSGAESKAVDESAHEEQDAEDQAGPTEKPERN